MLCGFHWDITQTKNQACKKKIRLLRLICQQCSQVKMSPAQGTNQRKYYHLQKHPKNQNVFKINPYLHHSQCHTCHLHQRNLSIKHPQTVYFQQQESKFLLFTQSKCLIYMLEAQTQHERFESNICFHSQCCIDIKRSHRMFINAKMHTGCPETEG